MAISARDTRTQTTTNFSLSKATGSNARKQTIQVLDLISEGPIEGLVNGSSSVYLNNDPVTPPTASPVTNNTVTLNEGAEVVTSIVQCTVTNGSKNVDLVPAIGDEEGFLRKIRVKAVFTSSVDQTVDPYTPDPNVATLRAPEFSTFPSWLTEQGPETTARLIPSGDFAELSEAIEGYISEVSGNIATFIPKNPNTRAFTRSNPYILEVDWRGVVDTSVTPNQLKVDWPRESGTYDVILSSPFIDRSVYGDLSNNQLSSFNLITNPNSSVEFRTGTLYQKPVNTLGGFSSTSISNANFQPAALEFIDSKSESVGEAAAPALISASSPTGLGLTAEQISLTDSVRLTFSYSSLVSTNTETGNTEPAAALHKIEVLYVRDGLEYTVVVANPRKHTNGQRNKPSSTPVAFEELINLEPLKPFTDFKIRVTRLTRHDGTGIATDGTDRADKYTMSALANVSRAVSVIKERFNYPLTSYAAVTYSSKEFPNTPIRTYHVRGIKVRVPSNYTTREQAGLNSNTNTLSNPWHRDNLYDGFWNGALTTETVYTNNPAWIFYDIVTSNRYGLGDWLAEDDIDKYMLYRIARYCDELVPDGKGGYEPRFTANLYLTKAADAYKVLKDISTIFRGIIYWMDQKVMVVNESPSEAVYTFGSSNVIDGSFNYETTGSKTRVNQVIVSWNNPESNYELEPLLLQDVENIATTGRIVSQDAVAFGCTSEGQAYRYGQWKLWTAKNQTEIVSFKASLEGAFLMPGDIVKVQDQSEYNIPYSGRIASATATSVTLDRDVILNEGSTYELSAIFTDTSEENGSDNEPKYTRVEEVSVTSSAGQHRTLSCSAFSEAPDANTVFVLKETVTNTQKVSDASYKEYRIVSISEEENMVYSITAIEYYDAKFSAVDNNFNLNVDEREFPTLNQTTNVFPPRNAYIIPSPDPSLAGNEFSVQWEKPLDSLGSISDNVSGFEIHHEIPGDESPIFVGSDVYSYKFTSVPDGLYKIRVRTVDSLGKKSIAAVAETNLVDNFSVRTQRAQDGLAIGGVVGSNLEISTNSFGFTYSNPGLISSGNPSSIYKGNITDLNLQNVSVGTYYCYFQYETGSLKVIEYFSDNEKRVNFWVEAASGVAQTVSRSGTVFVPEGSNKVSGSSTSFTSEYYDGSIVFFGNNKAAKVLRVVSDSVMFIDRSFNEEISNSTHSRNALKVDFLRDTIVAELVKTTENTTFNSFMSIDATIKPQTTKVVNIYRKNANTFTSGTTFGTFENPVESEPLWSLSIPELENGDTLYLSSRTFSSDGLAPQETNWSTPVVFSRFIQGNSPALVSLSTDRQTFGYTPEGNLLNTNLSATITATAANVSGVITYNFLKNGSSVQNSASNTYTYTPENAHADMPSTISVELLEDGEVVSTDSLSIVGLRDTANDITVVLSNEIHTIPANSVGIIPAGGLSGSNTTISVYEGLTQIPYVPGTSQNSEWDITATPSASVSVPSSNYFTDNGNDATASDISGLIGNSGYIDFTVTGKTEFGTSFTRTVRQSFTKTKDGLGISSISKDGNTVTVTFDDNSTDEFTVTGISSVTEDSDGNLVITYDDNTTSTIADGDPGLGIASIVREGDTVTVTFDDDTTATYTVTDGLTPAVGDPDYVTVPAIVKSESGAYSAEHLDVDFTFRREDTIVAKRRYRVSRNGDSWSTDTPTTLDGDISDETNVDRLTPSVSVSGQSAVLSVSYSEDSGTTVLSTAKAPLFITINGTNGVDGTTPVKGTDYFDGISGFLYFESGDNTTDSTHITTETSRLVEGQVAIVENSSGDQAGYIWNGDSWESKELVNSGIIVADAIGAAQLEISADASNTADSIFFDGSNNSIKIFSDDGNGNAVLRVRLGNLVD